LKIGISGVAVGAGVSVMVGEGNGVEVAVNVGKGAWLNVESANIGVSVVVCVVAHVVRINRNTKKSFEADCFMARDYSIAMSFILVNYKFFIKRSSWANKILLWFERNTK
jgi:hypothetical protein